MREFISVVLIAKNEAKPVDLEADPATVRPEETLLGRCIASVRGADQVVVLDTGSTDATKEISRTLGAEVYETDPIIPFHFAEARNRALAHAKHDWCISIDADEVMFAGSMKLIRKAAERNPDAGSMNITFVMRSESSDKPYPIQKTKVFRRSVYEWRYRVHELIFPKEASAKPRMLELPEASIEHRPLPDKKARHGQNLELLRLCVKESPEYLRASRQLALELMLLKEWEEAVPNMARWLELMPVDDPLERSEASCYIGECYAELGNLKKALAWFDAGSKASPNLREPLYRASWWLIKTARLPEALDWLERMLKIPRSGRPKVHLAINAAWDDHGEPQRMIEFCRQQLGLVKAETS
jgi:tetratricopeptide (TPR) repeat protein